MQVDPSTVGHERRSAAMLLLASAVIGCAIQLGTLVPNHDIAWLLELSQRMLNGGKYYTDFYELNPPLYPVLLLPIDLLSRFVGLAPYTVLVIAVSGLLYYVSLQLFACLAVLAPNIGFSGRAALGIYMQAALFFLPGYDFGQRDPVALCLTLPLMCWFAAERPTSTVSGGLVLAAVLAAIGVLIKPFLAGVVVLAMLVRVVSTRKVAELLLPVVLPAVVVATVYVILIFKVFPEWIVMAHVAGDSYSMYDIHTYAPKWFTTAVLLIAGLAVTNEYVQSSPAARRALRYFVAAAVGALVSYVSQRKGFSYHLAPTKIMLGLLLAITGVAVLERLKAWIGARAYQQRALLVSLAMLLVAFSEDIRSLHVQQPQVRFYARLAAKLTDVYAGNRLFFFSTGLPPQFPLNLYYHFTPSSRFPCLWTLPAAIARESGAQPQAPGATAGSDELRKLVVQDFQRWAPTAFVVAEGDHMQGLASGFDFLPWFRKDPRMAEILDRYELASLVPETQAAGDEARGTYAIYVLRGQRASLARAAPRSGD